jgi:NitT/TauT family transport system permease protein
LREDPSLIWRGILAAACLGAIFGLWSWGASGDDGNYLVPPPTDVLGSFTNLLDERDLVSNIFISLKRVVLGFGLAVLIAVPLGIVAASFRVVNAFLAPLQTFFRNTPMATLVPLTMVLFSLSEKQKIAFIFMATFAFVLSDTVAAVMTIPQRYVETAETVGASRRQIVIKVLTPLALPDITTSIRFLFGLGFGYIILAEMLDLSSGGLGAMIIVSQRRSNYDEMYMIVFVIVALAFVIDKVLHFFQRGVFPYRKDL